MEVTRKIRSTYECDVDNNKNTCILGSVGKEKSDIS